jgi:hypothetical protein
VRLTFSQASGPLHAMLCPCPGPDLLTLRSRATPEPAKSRCLFRFRRITVHENCRMQTKSKKRRNFSKISCFESCFQ